MCASVFYAKYARLKHLKVIKQIDITSAALKLLCDGGSDNGDDLKN